MSDDGAHGTNGVLERPEDVAAHFGISRRTAYRRIKSGMPRRLDGKFDVAAIDAWEMQRQGVAPMHIGGTILSEHHQPQPLSEEEKVAPGNVDKVIGEAAPEVVLVAATNVQKFAPGDDSKDSWAREDVKYRALNRKLKWRIASGSYVPVSMVEDLFVERVLEVKQAFLGLAKSLPPDLMGCASEVEMSALIIREIRAICERFARELPMQRLKKIDTSMLNDLDDLDSADGQGPMPQPSGEILDSNDATD